MQVQVNISPDLKKIGVRTVALAEGSDSGQLLEQLGIPVDQVGVISVNGRQAMLDQTLHAGDVVHIVPSIGGG